VTAQPPAYVLNDLEGSEASSQLSDKAQTARLCNSCSGRPWRSFGVVPAAWLGHIASIGIIYSFGILLPAFQAEWPYASAGDLGILGSALTGCFFGSSIIVSKIMVRVGHNRAALFGACLIAAGWLAVFPAQKHWQAYPGICLLGVGLNFVWTPGLALLPAHFPMNKATVSGIAVTGSGFGSLFWSWTIKTLLAEVGLRTAILVIAAVNAGMALVAAAGYAPVPQQPTSVSEIQDGRISNSNKAAEASGKEGADLEADGSEQSVDGLKLEPVAPMLVEHVVPLSKDPVYYGVCFAAFLCTLGFMSPFTHVAAFASELGCGEDAGAGAYMVFGVFSILGRLLAGPLGDRFGALIVWASFLPFCAGALLWLGMATTCGQISASMGAYGLFSGPVIALLAPLLVELFGLTRLPVALGPLLLANGFGSMLAPAIAGHMRDFSGSYTVSFMIASACILSASFVSLFVRSLHSRRHQCAKSTPTFIK